MIPPRTKTSEDEKNMRRCLVSQESFPKERLLRFVLSPENDVTFDLKNTLPGRGFWIQADRSSLQTALKKSVFAKKARQQVTIRDDLLEHVEHSLRTQGLNLLGLAFRAGFLTCGFEKTCQALRQNHVNLLLIAHDTQPNSRKKVSLLAKDCRILYVYSSLELSKALGRDQVKFIVLRKTPQTARLFVVLNCLERIVEPHKQTPISDNDFKTSK